MRSAAILLAAAACTSRPPALHDDPQAIAYRSRAKVPDAAAQKLLADLSLRAGGIAAQQAETQRRKIDQKYRDRR
jgi:hypothetical protein